MIYAKKIAHLSDFFEVLGAGLMLCIIFLAYDFPIPGLHRLATIRQVALGAVGLLVGDDLREIFLARFDHACDDLEACTGVGLVSRERSGTFMRRTQVEAVTLIGGRGSRAVRREQHLLAAVLTTLTGFCQCAGYMINSGRISYICHVVRAILVSATKLRFMGSYSDALTLRSARTTLAYVPRGEPSKLDERFFGFD